MKNTFHSITAVTAALAISSALSSCEQKTVYVERTVYAKPKKEAPKTYNDPDSFDAVAKPTSYSY